MRVLFLHQNFPGQFAHIAAALRDAGHEVVAITAATNRLPRLIPTRTYAFDPAGAPAGVPLARDFTPRLARGAAVAEAMFALRAEGFTPDVVVGHPGWGETLFVRDVWPAARLLIHAEFFYSAAPEEVGFDPEFCGMPFEMFPVTVRARNLVMTLALQDADLGVAPTAWQASRFPEAFRAKLRVVHEGVDTDVIKPDPSAAIVLKQDGLRLRPGDEVVTFVSRELEPHRGYHVFMRALPAILERRPKAHVFLVGGHGSAYGPPPAGRTGWKDVFLGEVRERIDLSRVHFLGKVSRPALTRLLQVSAAHVYLTYPSVLSWSMLEAMSAGALVIGSRTPPVEEAIEDGKTGLLVDFFDVDRLAGTVVEALARQANFQAIRQAARESVVARYDLKRICLPGWRGLIEA